MPESETSPTCHLTVDPHQLYAWCKIPAEALPHHPGLRIPYRQITDSRDIGPLMATELAETIEGNNRKGLPTRVIIPCGPRSWCEPFAQQVNTRRISLKKLTVFHMDECLDWQGRLLPRNHPYNFRTFMEKHFYDPVRPEFSVPEPQRFWMTPATIEAAQTALTEAPLDLTLAGWGQDGHIAYNQASRHPYLHPTIEDLRNSTIRIQNNSTDTIISVAERTFGLGYQFAPPMSITLGMRECLSAKRIRVYSATRSWKQTALRVVLFSEPVAEYPMTLLQEHPDALITATLDTARHPISEHPEWELF